HPADARALSLGQSPLGTTHRHGFLMRLALPVVGALWPLEATPPDVEIGDGESLERFGLDACVLHTPGHTPGHTCLLLEGGVAFAGDLVARHRGPKLQDLLATDWAQLGPSLARLQAAHPAEVYTGHQSRPIPGPALQQLRPR
ncbi:MAG: MBL fold metallo-hydrolase, partial [Chloroflexi bacterium]|nr:MBL fold metallo-hydrolase [Chloroflexota bacterium]